MQHPFTQASFAAFGHRVTLPATTQAAPLLSVSNVIRDYRTSRKSWCGATGHFRAVDEVSFEVGQGERLGLVGESGCGKSTLTRAILGLEPVQCGTITLDGEPILIGQGPNPTVRPKMQVVFPNPYGSFNPRHKIERLITEQFHLIEDAPAGTARQTAVALITSPALVIFDEAVSAPAVISLHLARPFDCSDDH